MSPPPRPPARSDVPALSPERLLQVLGLDPTATATEVRHRGRCLLAHLEQRRLVAEGADGEEEAADLEREIEEIWRAVAAWPESADLERGRPIAPNGSQGRDAPRRVGVRLAVGVVALALVAAAFHLAGTHLASTRAASAPSTTSTRAQLIIESDPPDAAVWIRPPGSAEVLHELRAVRARVELDPGRYTLEASREDCPDTWSETVELEAGQTRRFAPRVCRGDARLVVRSNVADDRLRIDGYDRGTTGPEPVTLPVGDHTVRVDKEGYEPFEARVRLAPDEQLELRANLAAQSEQPAARGRPLPVERRMPTPPPPSPSPMGGTFDPSGERSGSESAAGTPPGGGSETTQAPSEPDPMRSMAPLPMPTRLLWSRDPAAERPRGGSTSWHDAVSRELLARYDSDRSGRIDRVEESERIPCALWREIEQEFDEGGLGLSLGHNYGFDGSEWIEGALGFSREIRSAAHARMQECGLDP